MVCGRLRGRGSAAEASSRCRLGAPARRLSLAFTCLLHVTSVRLYYFRPLLHAALSPRWPRSAPHLPGAPARSTWRIPD